MWDPSGRDRAVGAPFPVEFPKLVKEVVGFGDYEDGQGTRIIIHDGNILFLSSGEGLELTVGVTIERMLEVIGEYNKETGC